MSTGNTNLIECIGSIDQGTSSSRFLLFNYNGIVIDSEQIELRHILFNNNNINLLRNETGLPLSHYFSAMKLIWLIENNNYINKLLLNNNNSNINNIKFGTIDSWILYNLTNAKLHITDITNASRT